MATNKNVEQETQQLTDSPPTSKTKTAAESKESSNKEKKCRACGAPAHQQNTLIFAVDIGFSWSVEKVYLCDLHAENLDDSAMDQLYVKNRLAHLTRVRQRQNKAIPPSTTAKKQTGKTVKRK